jgi:hypothetical protein
MLAVRSHDEREVFGQRVDAEIVEGADHHPRVRDVLRHRDAPPPESSPQVFPVWEPGGELSTLVWMGHFSLAYSVSMCEKVC